MALTESTMLELGTTAPDFALPDVVTGKTVRRDDFRGQKGLLVMFICTHCPYVKHIEKGLAALGTDYDGQAGHCGDQQQRCAELSRRQPGGIEAAGADDGVSHFLISTTSRKQVARAYKAACTPDIYLFDAEIEAGVSRAV